jgi:hypothetical protein
VALDIGYFQLNRAEARQVLRPAHGEDPGQRNLPRPASAALTGP